jgi:Fic family protein
MREEDFIHSESGRIHRNLEGNLTFLPNPLPPRLDLTQLTDLVSETSMAIGELRGTARKVANPYLFISPLQRREALTTSAMEGTHTDISQLILFEDEDINQQDENAKEASNYVRALQHAINAMQRLPLSHRVIKEAHRKLLGGLSDFRGANKRPGEYKIHQNWIGGGRNIQTARYVPPPPEKTQDCMDALEAYINRDVNGLAEKLIDLAIVHYQFEAIHPFADGNGRLGRMIVTLMAMDPKLVGQPLLYVSPVLESRKDEYIDLMHGVSTQSRWIPWITFFLKTVQEACAETTQKTNAMADLQIEYYRRAHEVGRSIKLQLIIDELFNRPFTTIPNVEKRLAITYAAAKNLIDQLVQAKVLIESGKISVNQAKGSKVFVAPELIAISDR